MHIVAVHPTLRLYLVLYSVLRFLGSHWQVEVQLALDFEVTGKTLKRGAECVGRNHLPPHRQRTARFHSGNPTVKDDQFKTKIIGQKENAFECQVFKSQRSRALEDDTRWPTGMEHAEPSSSMWLPRQFCMPQQNHARASGRFGRVRH
jgi:hypothetical protein